MSDEEDTAELLINPTINIRNQSDLIIRNKDEVRYIKNHRLTLQQTPNSKRILLLLTKRELGILSCTSLLVGTVLGYEIGLATTYLQVIGRALELNCIEENIIVTAWLVGGLLSSVFGGYTVDKAGRRWSILSSSFVLMVAALWASLSNSFPLFFFAKILIGFSGSLLVTSQCIYVVECQEAGSRGKGACLIPMGGATGLLIAALVGQSQANWRIAIGAVCLPLIVIFVLVLFFLPVSPHFNLLLQTGSHTRLRKHCPPSPYLIKTISLCLVVGLIHQLTGHVTIRYATSRAMDLLGMCLEKQQGAAVLTLAVVQALSTILLTLTIDKLGRRVSILIGTIIMAISLLLLSLVYYTEQSSLHTRTNTALSITPDTLYTPVPFSQNYELDSDHAQSCNRIIIGGTTGFVISPKVNFYQLDVNGDTDEPKSYIKTPFPILPTPLPLMSNIVRDNCVDDVQTVVSSLSAWIRVATIVLLCVYEAGHTFGSSFVLWILFSELLPCFLRGRVLAVIMGFNWIFDIIVQDSFAVIVETVSLPGLFVLHAVFCFVTSLVVFLLLPETRNLTLHQVAQVVKNVSYCDRILEKLTSLPGFSRLKKPVVQHVENGSTLI